MINIRGLLLSELVHLLLTLGISFLLFYYYRDWRLLLACFVFGFFIDIDHWFDYFVRYGSDINLARFFGLSGTKIPEKIYVLFHGWEFIIPFWFVGRWMGKRLAIKGLEWAVALSYLGHLLLDNFSFSHHPWSYSFLYRLLNGFSQKSFDGV